MSKTFSFNYFGSIITAEPLGINAVPPIQETLTSHCIPFTDNGEIVAVHIIGRGVDIPGGHIEDNESAVDAMIRETHEEAHITIENPTLIDVWRLSSTNEQLGLLQKPYLLLYQASVVSMDTFVPNNEAGKRLILAPEEFIAQYFGDTQQARIMVDRALVARK